MADRIGSGASQSISGHTNQRSKMRDEAKGVASETAAMPSAVSTSAPRSHSTAFFCRSPSVL